MDKCSIAVIPARGGSKRIPKKNIKDFLGKPIIAYAISTAKNAGVFDEVMVSTDDAEIADISRQFGASVPFMRSNKNSGDSATTEDVIMEVLREYKMRGWLFDYVTCIYPTAALITSDILVRAIELMKTHTPAVVIPLIQYSYPPQRSFVIGDDGFAKYLNPQYTCTRSQDLEPLYHDAGQFYVYNVRKLFQKRGIIEDDYYPIVVPEIAAQDIDNLSDWKMAELKYKLKRE